MASIASKLARAAVASRASLAAVGGCSGPVSPCLPRRLDLIGRRMCSSVTPYPEGTGFQIPVDRPSAEEAKQALTVTDEILSSDEALWAMYEYWRKYYGVSRDPAQINRRFKIFKRNARFVHKTNNLRGSPQLGMNMFADQTLEEITGPGCYPFDDPAL